MGHQSHLVEPSFSVLVGSIYPMVVLFVCGSLIQYSCFPEICLGQNFIPGNIYCSMQYIRYGNNDNIDNNAIRMEREHLLEQNKNQLWALAHSLGAKISYCPPGQASENLPKEGIISCIMEKQFISQLVSAAGNPLGTENGTGALPSPSVVTIHNNFRLVNVMFFEEVMDISSQCRSTSTRSELDTNMGRAKSPIWNKVSSLFHSTSGCSRPTDGVDFLDKVHFEHIYYSQHHEEFNPSKHGYFPNKKLKSMWSKIKSDYDQDIVNFTKSGSYFSSFTVAAMQELKRQEMETLKAPSTTGRASDEASSSSSSNNDNDD